MKFFFLITIFLSIFTYADKGHFKKCIDYTRLIGRKVGPTQLSSLKRENNEIKKIGIFRLSALGDIIWTVPLVRELQKEFPEAKIYYYVDKNFASVVEMIGGVEVIVVEKPRSLSAYREIVSKIQEVHFDIFFCSQANLRVNLIYPFIKAKRKIGFDSKRGRDGHTLFVKEQISYKEEHSLEAFRGFFFHLTGKEYPVEFRLKLGSVMDTPSSPFIAIHPVASSMQRTWSAKRYAKLIDYISKELGKIVVLTGTSSDSHFISEIEEKSNSSLINLAGRTNLKELAYLYSKSDLVIAPDSGPIHLAQAVGAKTVGLYAALPPEYTGPYGQESNCINAYPRACEKFLGLSINEVPWRKRVKSDDLMDLITVEEVTFKVREVLSR